MKFIFCLLDFDADAIERGDSYIDRLLKDMFEDRVEEYDPYILEDSSVGFHRKITFVNVSGEAKLHNGYINGLKTLHRANHCSLEEKNGRLHVKADLGAGVLKFHYSGSVKFMNFGPTITVEGNLAYLGVHMKFSVDSDTGRNGKLTEFTIDDMRGMEVWMSGLGPINWAMNPIISGVTKLFKRFIKNFMERKVKGHIAQNIENFQFPVEPGLETEATEIVTTVTELPTSTAEPTELEITDEFVSETSEPLASTEEPTELEITDEPVSETFEPIAENEEPEEIVKTMEPEDNITP